MSKRVQDSYNVPSTEKLDTEITEKNPKTTDVDGEYVQAEGRLKQNSAASWLGQGTNGEAGCRLLALCQRGDWLGVDGLLKRVNKDDIPPDLADEKTGYTPLMYAVKENRVVFVERFLELGLNVNARTKDGLTALHLAAIQTRETIIHLLLNKRADPTIIGGAKDQLPIHILCGRPTGAAITPLQMLLRSSSKNMRLWLDKDGNIPFLLAVESGNHGVCRELMSSEAREQLSFRRQKTGDIALHIATRRHDVDLVRYLLESGSPDGSTLLHIASAAGHPETAMIFMKKGVPLHMSNKAGAKCIHTAAQKGYVNVVRTLIQKGENVDVTTN
ncbi:ankyrin-1-like, partial [Limulus polyphemus]|uniref:Alpha-latrotoxin n=1 Tax=Limulus polyphemus TaxID=6850 RepID=A0ABM1C4Z9_LIMPO